MHNSLKETIWQWTFHTKFPLIKNLWSLILPMTCWYIWKERNNRIFREAKCTSQVVFDKICKAIKENINIPHRNNKQWFFADMNDFDWVKVNFDGATKGNPGKARGGGVNRNSQGVYIAAIASPYGVQNNHVVEAQAMLKCLQMAQGFKF